MMIRVRPDMEVWSQHSPDHIRLQRLDWSNIRVIAAVLGQSVALDFYARYKPPSQLHTSMPDTNFYAGYNLIFPGANVYSRSSCPCQV